MKAPEIVTEVVISIELLSHEAEETPSISDVIAYNLGETWWMQPPNKQGSSNDDFNLFYETQTIGAMVARDTIKNTDQFIHIYGYLGNES